MNPARLAVTVVLLCQSCALFSKGDVPVRRFYDPMTAELSAPPGSPVRSNAELRLGRVTSGESIDERVIFRKSPNEIGFYDDRAWTERPEVYLRRELSRALFEDRGLRASEHAGGPTLEVELVGFEEVKAPSHVGRVTIAMQLSDAKGLALQQTISVDKPVAQTASQKEGGAVAQAMGEALHAAVEEVAGRVLADLDRQHTAGLAGCPENAVQGAR